MQKKCSFYILLAFHEGIYCAGSWEKGLPRGVHVWCAILYLGFAVISYSKHSWTIRPMQWLLLPWRCRRWLCVAVGFCPQIKISTTWAPQCWTGINVQMYFDTSWRILITTYGIDIETVHKPYYGYSSYPNPTIPPNQSYLIALIPTIIERDHSGYGLSQWETLCCNRVSHWLSPCSKWPLIRQGRGDNCVDTLTPIQIGRHFYEKVFNRYFQ